MNSPHKGQWRGALMFALIRAWINDSVNNREAGDLRRYRAHYDVIVMIILSPYFSIKTDFPDTVWCGHNAVNFPTNIHNKRTIARPLGRGMGCFCGSSIWLVFCLSFCNYSYYNIRPCYSSIRLYGDSYNKDKTVVRLSYLYHGNPYTGKSASLYWNAPWYPLV